MIYLKNTSTPQGVFIPKTRETDGSLIFSMYAPSNAVAPASGTWDLKGLEFDNFHTFGMNNDVRGEYEVQNIPNFEGIIFTSNCFKGTRNTSTYAGYFQMGWLNLNNATVITSSATFKTSVNFTQDGIFIIDNNGNLSENVFIEEIVL